MRKSKNEAGRLERKARTLALVACVLVLALAMATSASAMSKRNRKVVKKLYDEAVRKYGKERLVRDNGVRWCAHRGFMSLAPENTEPALELAGMCGATAVEFDVRMTKDGKLILMHDPSVTRMTNGKGKVRDKTYESISKLKINGGKNAKKFKNLRVCTFEKALKICRKYGMSAHVELKAEGNAKRRKKFVRKVYKTLKRYGMLERSEIVSFSVKILMEWRSVAKKGVCRPLSRNSCSEKEVEARKKKYSKGNLPKKMRGTKTRNEPPKVPKKKSKKTTAKNNGKTTSKTKKK